MSDNSKEKKCFKLKYGLLLGNFYAIFICTYMAHADYSGVTKNFGPPQKKKKC